ncbi:MAG: O-antigen ligase family protein [Chitinophagales bacterium]|nr:O-antigen ligase family protein [Bacteroidota bacterium]MCB9256178.1 O-antigen ligase family protein [Chitinophagales bacterium]
MNNIKNRSQKLGDKLFLLGSILMAVLLPLHKMATTIAFIIMLVGFLLAKKEGSKNREINIALALLAFFFLLHLVFYFPSTYKKFGVNDLRTKLPLLILPSIILFKAKFDKINLLFQVFVMSCSLVSLGILFRFLLGYIQGGELLFSERLLDFSILHPGYLSMYLLFAMVLLFELNTTVLFIKNKSLVPLLIAFFAFILLLLASRMAIVLALILLTIFLFRSIAFKYALLSTIVVLCFSALMVWKLPVLNEKWLKAKAMLSSESLEVNNYSVDDRIMIWKNAAELIKEKAFRGYNLGDYCYYHLREKHNVSGFGKGYRQQLNAHNQFLESWLALGLLGFIGLLTIYLFNFYLAFTWRSQLLFYFLCIVFSFSLIESIFQSQGGILFFAFFLALLYRMETKKLNHE